MRVSNSHGAPARILIADDHEVMRLGIRNLLESRPEWEICAEACNGQEAIDKARISHPDVIVLDITMPVMNGLEAANFLRNAQPATPIILFSLHLSEELVGSFTNSGIRGAVCKNDAARDLVDAVATVLNGGTFFPGEKSQRTNLASVTNNRVPIRRRNSASALPNA